VGGWSYRKSIGAWSRCERERTMKQMKPAALFLSIQSNQSINQSDMCTLSRIYTLLVVLVMLELYSCKTMTDYRCFQREFE